MIIFDVDYIYLIYCLDIISVGSDIPPRKK